MRRLLLALFALLLTTAAFAHGGKSHKLMGTVAAVTDSQLVIDKPGGGQATVALAAETKYEKQGKPVDRSALAAGVRVSVDLTEDDKTATKVKIGGAAPQEHN